MAWLSRRIPDRALGELAIVVVRQQHHADRVREHQRGRLLAGKLRVHLAAKRDVECGRRRQITHRQVHENHLAHHFLLHLGRELRHCLAVVGIEGSSNYFSV